MLGKDLGIHQLTFFKSKSDLLTKSGKANDKELETDMCKNFRLAIVQEIDEEHVVFLSDCSLTDGPSNEALLYNNFNKFKAYKIASDKSFHELSIA